MSNLTPDIPPAYYRVSIKLCLFLGDQLILVQEDSALWDFPGGGVEHGETLCEGLARELQEELGLHANLDNLGSPLQAFILFSRRTHRPLFQIVYLLELPADTPLSAGAGVTIKYLPIANRQTLISQIINSTDYLALLQTLISQ